MSGQQKWKAAVIGTGNVAQKAHLPFYAANEDVDLIGICGRDEEHTKAVAATFGIQQFFTDVKAMLQTCQPNVVSVCSPNNLHFTHVMQCLEAGCHVLCEKPPAINFEQAQMMQAKAAQQGVVLAYNLQQRQLAEVLLLKKYIAQNFFGKIYHIKAIFIRRRGIPNWGSFTSKAIQGGGALIDIGIHMLDVALHLLGYPALKNALGSLYDYIGKAGGKGQFGEWDGEKFTVEDSCFAHLQLQNNCSVSIETAFALHIGQERIFSIEIFGEKGGGVFPPLTLFSDNDGEAVVTVCDYEPEIHPQEKNLKAFLKACNGGSSNICTANEGSQLQKMVETIYISALNSKRP